MSLEGRGACKVHAVPSGGSMGVKGGRQDGVESWAVPVKALS